MGELRHTKRNSGPSSRCTMRGDVGSSVNVFNEVWIPILPAGEIFGLCNQVLWNGNGWQLFFG